MTPLSQRGKSDRTGAEYKRRHPEKAKEYNRRANAKRPDRDRSEKAICRSCGGPRFRGSLQQVGAMPVLLARGSLMSLSDKSNGEQLALSVPPQVRRSPLAEICPKCGAAVGDPCRAESGERASREHLELDETDPLCIRLSSSSPPWSPRAAFGAAHTVASAARAFSEVMKAARGVGQPEITLWFHGECWKKFLALLQGE